MSVGSLTFDVTNLRGQTISGRLHIDLDPHQDAKGGAPMDVDFDVDGHRTFTVTGIECHSGLGTLYEIRLTAPAYEPYAFFQRIEATTKNLPSESRVRLMINPKKVKAIDAPDFTELPASFRRGLDGASMLALAGEDADLVGRKGPDLYDALGPLRQACLLNLVAKATHPSSGRISRFVLAPTVLRQDRCFASVDPAMPDFLRGSQLFKSAPSLLHKPPSGFELVDSFKTKDAHANLQVTFMRERTSNALWADIDIDEASGIEHGFEVIRNIAVDGRTNPCLVRELLLLSEFDTPIDPGYDFLLR